MRECITHHACDCILAKSEQVNILKKENQTLKNRVGYLRAHIAYIGVTEEISLIHRMCINAFENDEKISEGHVEKAENLRHDEMV